MTKTLTADYQSTIEEIKKLEDVGCQIIRCAVPDEESAYALGKIKKQINIPLVADIHFNHKLALIAAQMGVDKLRINPGNIGSLDNIEAVVKAAEERKIPIRIGVNSGSLEKEILAKYKHVTAKALVESAMKNVKLLEMFNFFDIVISIKATSVPMTLEAYRLISKKVNYPLHIGITESGIPKIGMIKSSVGIGILLSEGIGDTIRVSLTSEPTEEVRVAYEILKSLELSNRGLTIISCPTCGRCRLPMIKVAEEIEAKTRGIIKPIKVAIMGCEVNGPGEAKEADIGLAGGLGTGIIFRRGKVVKKVPEDQMVNELLKEIVSF